MALESRRESRRRDPRGILRTTTLPIPTDTLGCDIGGAGQSALKGASRDASVLLTEHPEIGLFYPCWASEEENTRAVFVQEGVVLACLNNDGLIDDRVAQGHCVIVSCLGALVCKLCQANLERRTASSEEATASLRRPPKGLPTRFGCW